MLSPGASPLWAFHSLSQSCGSDLYSVCFFLLIRMSVYRYVSLSLPSAIVCPLRSPYILLISMHACPFYLAVCLCMSVCLAFYVCVDVVKATLVIRHVNTLSFIISGDSVY